MIYLSSSINQMIKEIRVWELTFIFSILILIKNLSYCSFFALISQNAGTKYSAVAIVASNIGNKLGHAYSYDLFLSLKSNRFCRKWLHTDSLLSHTSLLITIGSLLLIGILSLNAFNDTHNSPNQLTNREDRVFPFWKMVRQKIIILNS